MPADALSPSDRPAVAVGRYVLEVGDPAGMAIKPTDIEVQPQALAQAIAQARRERETQLSGRAALEGAAQDASKLAGKIESALSLFTEIAEGRLDEAAITSAADALLGQLQRLHHDERWEEALRVARLLAMLLALLERWVELLRALRTAVSAAEQLGDSGAKAWVLHELGTLHLAGERPAEADRMLTQARELREQIGDRRGMAMTDRNLQVLCRALRARLHTAEPVSLLARLIRRPVAALALGMLLLVGGAAAGASLHGSSTGSPASNRLLIVKVAFEPASPLVGEPVAFRAVVENAGDPAHYVWRFGDGNGANTASPTYAYRRSGTDEVTVQLRDAHGTTIGEGTRTVVVRTKRPTDTRGASASTTGKIVAKSSSPSVPSTKAPTSPSPSPPTKPTKVTAGAYDESATLTWAAPTNSGSAITEYTITPYIGSSAQPKTTVEGSPPTTSTTITGLANGTSYTFTVEATNTAGTGPASEHSNAVTPATKPFAPTDVRANPGDESATVSWVAPADGGSPISKYTISVYRGVSESPTTTTTITGSPPETSAMVSHLLNGSYRASTDYTFTVTASNAQGEGPASERSNSVTPQEPAPQ